MKSMSLIKRELNFPGSADDRNRSGSGIVNFPCYLLLLHLHFFDRIQITDGCRIF